MTLNDAFDALTIEHIEVALAADETQGFPQDVFGLARLMLRTFSVLDLGCVRLDGSTLEPVGTDNAIEQRIAGMVELERLRTREFDEPESFDNWPRDTRH